MVSNSGDKNNGERKVSVNISENLEISICGARKCETRLLTFHKKQNLFVINLVII
jgi:hypothetical protein